MSCNLGGNTNTEYRRPVYVLAVGYWLSLLILGPVSLFVLPDEFMWIGIAAFWLIVAISAVLSWYLSGLKFKQWYDTIGLYGVRKLARAMSKLSREPGCTDRANWEFYFEMWWGISIKYFCPFALWWLLMLSLHVDIIESPYGGYNIFWQYVGFSYPMIGLLTFIICFIWCT